MQASRTGIVLCATGLALVLGHGPAAAESSDLVVVVEDTPEAREADPTGARWQTVDVARQLLSGDDRLGVVTYGEQGSVASPLAAADSHPPARAPKTPAEPGGGTNPLAGVDSALDTLEQGRREGANPSMLVVVVTEPGEPESSLLQRVVERARRLGAAVHGLRAKGKKSPTFLEELSGATGGTTRRVGGPRVMPLTFQTIFDRLLPGRGTELPDGRLPVDPSIRQARFVVETADARQVNLVRPNGKRLKADDRAKGVRWVAGGETVMVTVNKPSKGTWRMDAPHGARVRAWVETAVRLEATLGFTKVKPRSSVPVRARLTKLGRRLSTKGLPASMTMSVAIPEVGPEYARTLRDDGAEEDDRAEDGVYQGTLRAPPTPGLHDVVVRATAPGFFRRVVVVLEVSVGERARPEAEPEPTPEFKPPVKAEEAEAEAGLPLPLVLGGLAVAAIGVLLLVLWMRRRRDPFGAFDDLDDADPQLDADEIGGVVDDYLAAAGMSLEDPPEGWPEDDRPVLLLDRRGAFTARVKKSITKGLAFERAEEEADARDRLQEAPTPEVLVLVDPMSRGTVRSLLHWLSEYEALKWLPVVRVVDRPTQRGVLGELKAGAKDVLAASADARSALQRFRRALFAGEQDRKRQQKPPRQPPAPAPEPEPSPPSEAPKAAEPAREPKYQEGDDFEWVADRLERLPLPLRITGPQGETSGVLVDVGFDGFAVAARRPSEPGTPWSFESDLFVSLALERVDGRTTHCLEVGAPGYPYLWEVDYDGLDDVHGKRIENCYWGLVNSL